MRVIGWIAAVLVGSAFMAGLVQGLVGIPARAPAAAPEHTAEIVNFTWRRGGFGTVVILSQITIKNLGADELKDFRIVCNMTAPSGTAVGTASTRLYEVLKPGQTRTFRDVNLGAVHSQATGGACHLKA